MTDGVEFDFQDRYQIEEWHLLGMSRRVALVRTDVSEELSASIIRVT
jgi:hypothetical protein